MYGKWNWDWCGMLLLLLLLSWWIFNYSLRCIQGLV
jgi:hypothetical protein